MVKIGFICEGETEATLLQSKMFDLFLADLGGIVVDVIDAQGAGNLLPHNIKPFVESLTRKGSEQIVILTDLDEDKCISSTKIRINAPPTSTIIIAVKEIESWFLAASVTMRSILKVPGFSFPEPEKESSPFQTINNLLISHTGRGIGKGNGGKIKLIQRLLNYNFNIREAIEHPRCPSAKYFANKLQTLTAIR